MHIVRKVISQHLDAYLDDVPAALVRKVYYMKGE
jgi:hypothetical protein